MSDSSNSANDLPRIGNDGDSTSPPSDMVLPFWSLDSTTDSNSLETEPTESFADSSQPDEHSTGVNVDFNESVLQSWPVPGGSYSWALPSTPVAHAHDYSSEFLAQMNFELSLQQPTVYGILFNPSYQAPSNNNNNNSNSFNLRTVPASVDLTRQQQQQQQQQQRSSSSWADYHARARTTVTPNLTTQPPAAPRQRAASTPSLLQLPLLYDPEYGVYIYIRPDTDEEAEPPPVPLAMVPRRGNSISDCSQCSSDDEPFIAR